MAGNPLVNQGFLNRVRATVTVTESPDLNVGASYLAREGFSMRPIGPATDVLPTMAGTVHSQVPYQQVEVTIHMLRTQSLAAAWQNRLRKNTSLGEVVVTPDTNTMEDFTVLNTALTNFQEMPLNGTDPSFVVTLSGYIIVNNDMWE